MKLYLYIFAFLFCVSSAYGQATEEDYLEAIQVHIDDHKPIKRIYSLINNYYRYCEKGNCNELDQVRFQELRYSWHVTNAKTFISLAKQFKKLHPNSLYTTQINQLLKFNDNKDEIMAIYQHGVDGNKLSDESCVNYSSIGVFQQFCDYLHTPFKVVVTDTTFTEEDYIYQFKYEGHDYKAPILKLLRGNGDGKINILSNDSSKGSIQVKKGYFQEINFTVLSNSAKKANITFNSSFDTESQLYFEPQVNLDNGIHLFNIKDASTPLTLQFSNTETLEEKRFVYSDPSELSSESLSSLVKKGPYTLKIEDGNGNVSKVFHLDIKHKESTIPWVTLLSILFFSTLFYYAYKWFKERKKTLRNTRPIHESEHLNLPINEDPNQIEPSPQILKNPSIEEVDENTSIQEEDVDEKEESPITSESSNVVAERIKPKINVSNVTNSMNEHSLSKAELNAIADSGEYLSLSLKQLWIDSLVKNVYIRKTMVHRMDLDVRDEENMNKEIGGFLLGKYYLKSSGSYDICLEEYIDIEGEGQSKFQIGFGADAWSKLEDSLQEFSHFDLIGWFHTHPGHGVFLSRPDKNISNNFFNKPYQVAMEIDPLLRAENPYLDTSFFTQKKNGDLNNNNDLVDKWHSWSDIVDRS